MPSYSTLPNKVISAPNGVDYTFRDAGEGEVPLVLLQHFRGNLDNWDPALVDGMANARRVIAFDNAGVAGSTGTTPDTVEQMARDAIAFIAAQGLSQVDLLGFSIGSFVAQQVALTRPAIVRRLILASTAPQGAAGMHGWAPDVIGAIGKPEPAQTNTCPYFFTSLAVEPAGRPAGDAAHVRADRRTGTRRHRGRFRSAG